MTTAPFSNIEIEEMIIERVAHYAGIAEESVDVSASFDELGLGSREAVAISGDLEDQLGIELSPTLAWEHPTLEGMARHLSERMNR